MTFPEVGVHENKEVLRLWLLGAGLGSIGRLARVDRKTVRRYVEAAAGCGLCRRRLNLRPLRRPEMRPSVGVLSLPGSAF